MRGGRILVAAATAAVIAGGCGSSSRATAPPKGAAGLAVPASVRTGTCLTWEQGPSGGPQRTARAVDCSAPHLAEVAGVVTLTGLGHAWPGTSTVEGAAVDQCGGDVAGYLGHPLDPTGRFGVSPLAPNQVGWDHGDRTAVCTLVATGPAGSATLTPITGRVAQVEPTSTLAVGTCLTEKGALALPVACATTHEVEVTGTATAPAGAKLPTSQPGWNTLIGPACSTDAARYLGAPLSLGVASGWLPVPAAAWATGQRQVPCLIGRQLDDGGWEPTTGSLQGKRGA